MAKNQGHQGRWHQYRAEKRSRRNGGGLSFQLSFPAAVPPLTQRPAVPLCSERGGGQVVKASKVGEIFTSQAATNFCVTPGRGSHSRGAKLDWWQAPRSSYNGRQQVRYSKADEALELSETCHRMFFPGPVRAAPGAWVAGLPNLAASLRPSLPWSRP